MVLFPVKEESIMIITVGNIAAEAKYFLSSIQKYTATTGPQPITQAEINIFYELLENKYFKAEIQIIHGYKHLNHSTLEFTFKGLWFYFLLKKGRL